MKSDSARSSSAGAGPRTARSAAAPRTRAWKPASSSGLDGGHDGVVELVEPCVEAVVELELAFCRDADDHAGLPSPPARAGPRRRRRTRRRARPSSAPARRRPGSGWRAGAAGGRCRPGRSRAAVRSSNVPAASSSETASARARICSVLSVARCMARPTSAISSPTPVAASEIRTWASAAEYCALMTSFLVRKASIFVRSFCSDSVSFCCWASSSVTCWSRDCSSVCATFLRSSATRASSSLPCAERLARLRVELDDRLLELLGLHLQALLRRDDVGDALLDVLQRLELLLVAVVERLGRGPRPGPAASRSSP